MSEFASDADLWMVVAFYSSLYTRGVKTHAEVEAARSRVGTRRQKIDSKVKNRLKLVNIVLEETHVWSVLLTPHPLLVQYMKQSPGI